MAGVPSDKATSELIHRLSPMSQPICLVCRDSWHGGAGRVRTCVPRLADECLKATRLRRRGVASPLGQPQRKPSTRSQVRQRNNRPEALSVRPRTADSYRGIVTRYLKPAIGRVPLAKLQPEHILAMLRDLEQREKQPLSPTTVRYVYVVLRIALGRALRRGHVQRNVATLIDPPTRDRRERQPLTAEQARSFLASLAGDPDNGVPADRLEALYRLAIASGLRQGELLGLRWQDVDRKGSTLSVRHTLQQGTNTLAEPKTERSRRTIALDEDTVESLRQHRLRQLEDRLAAGSQWQELDHVFATSVGTPIDHRNLVRSFHAALERAGQPRQHFHDLRHASATLGIEAGESLYEVSRRPGHANISTTADVYGHLTPSTTRRSADRMRGILAG